MSKRLQVLFEELEFRDIQRFARRKQLTVAEWVRQVLREARRREPASEVAKKLGSIRAAAKYDFPTADIGDMLAEIERGYVK